MTKQEAISAMRRGKKVRHCFFSDGEYMYEDYRGYVFGDGRVYEDKEDFWKYRTDNAWLTGWRVVNE